MSVDMRTVKVGDKVRLRSGAVAEITEAGLPGSYFCCHDGGQKLSVYVHNNGKCCVTWPEMDVIEILPACTTDVEKPKDAARPADDEQPFKIIPLMYCPYCGLRIYDETQDC